MCVYIMILTAHAYDENAKAISCMADWLKSISFYRFAFNEQKTKTSKSTDQQPKQSTNQSSEWENVEVDCMIVCCMFRM